MLGFHTVREGEKVAIWRANGTQEFVTGPTRFFNMLDTILTLRKVTAEENEYLVINFEDGHTEHRRGPATEWIDPVLHRDINVEQGIPIDANEAVVIYKENGGNVTRRIKRGPALLVLDANEWLHQFRWHGSDPEDETVKIPRALEFEKLRVIPDQLYLDVAEVRTNDEAMLTVKVMIFFELIDIELMLNRTHDPIADFINALTADAIEFIGKHKFEAFKEKTEALNDLGTYPQLTQRAEGIGYKINKVVYRGYHANETLQDMHDNAIETRTKLILDAEIEKQTQELEDLKLQKKIERELKIEEQAIHTTEHEEKIKRMQHNERLKQEREEHEAALKRQEENNKLALEKQKLLDIQRGELLQKMNELNIDLTQVLVAENKNPDKLINITSNEKAPQVHVHELE